MTSSGYDTLNVNKVETAVQLRFDARRSPSLPDDVSVRLQKLAGVIVIIAQTHRSQERNRAEALERLVELVREATKPPPAPVRPATANRPSDLLAHHPACGYFASARMPFPAWGASPIRA